MDVPRACCARAVPSAKECRRSGGWVSAISAQAMALPRAWSKGGKIGLAAPSWLVLQGHIPRGPTATPSLPRTQLQLAPCRRLDVGHKRLLLQKEPQGGSLSQLVRHGPLVAKLGSLLQANRGKRRAVAREGTTPGRHPLATAP